MSFFPQRRSSFVDDCFYSQGVPSWQPVCLAYTLGICPRSRSRGSALYLSNPSSLLLQSPPIPPFIQLNIILLILALFPHFSSSSFFPWAPYSFFWILILLVSLLILGHPQILIICLFPALRILLHAPVGRRSSSVHFVGPKLWYCSLSGNFKWIGFTAASSQLRKTFVAFPQFVTIW